MADSQNELLTACFSHTISLSSFHSVFGRLHMVAGDLIWLVHKSKNVWCQFWIPGTPEHRALHVPRNNLNSGSTEHGRLLHLASYPGCWFGTFSIFPYIGNNHPNWLIFFRGVGQPPTSIPLNPIKISAFDFQVAIRVHRRDVGVRGPRFSYPCGLPFGPPSSSCRHLDKERFTVWLNNCQKTSNLWLLANRDACWKIR